MDRLSRSRQDLNHGAGAERAGQIIAVADCCSQSALAQFRSGSGDFGLGVGTLVEQQTCATLKRGGKERDGTSQRGYGAGSDKVDGVGSEPRFSPQVDHIDVVERQRFGCLLHETSFLLGRFEQSEARIREDDGQRNTRKAGASTGVGDMGGGGEQAPRQQGVNYVFDYGFPFLEDASEVEAAVGVNDEVQMQSRLGNAIGTTGQVRGEQLVE